MLPLPLPSPPLSFDFGATKICQLSFPLGVVSRITCLWGGGMGEADVGRGNSGVR